MARAKFLVDAERCIECNACVTACKNEHEVPWGVNRRKVVTINDPQRPPVRSIVGKQKCHRQRPSTIPGAEDRWKAILSPPTILNDPRCRGSMESKIVTINDSQQSPLPKIFGKQRWHHQRSSTIPGEEDRWK